MNDSPDAESATRIALVADPSAPDCCGASRPAGSGPTRHAHAQPWTDGAVSTPAGEIPRAATRLTRADHIGTWKARWGIERMRYHVPPGLYAVGNPTPRSCVLVSANYKLSFDRLRVRLGSRDAWILVLDTKGINVWCAAGKGTFGTDELVRRVEVTRLAEVVTHRRLVLPQLGAPGVCAHEVTRRCRFRVVYGPVRAEDLPAFLDAGMKATPRMRRVCFPLRDRAVLIPVELVLGAKPAMFIAACFLVLGGLGPGIYSFDRVTAIGIPSASLFLAACVASVVFTPTLLPWLPGRAFAAKGAWLGLAFAGAVTVHAGARGGFDGLLDMTAWLLIIPAVASFIAMNFTGASTYTSLSGVRREMRIGVPIQALCGVIGAGLWLTGRFL